VGVDVPSYAQEFPRSSCLSTDGPKIFFVT
jgi:hypothetical protein